MASTNDAMQVSNRIFINGSFENEMEAEYDLDSKIFKDWPTRVIKSCAARPAIHYCFPQNCGCSSVVEHLLAKEDVASSSLVTRSSPEAFGAGAMRLQPYANADAQMRRRGVSAPQLCICGERQPSPTG